MDQNVYKYLTLPNKMKVLLISDPEATESYASVEVQVGTFNDPDDYIGTANYV